MRKKVWLAFGLSLALVPPGGRTARGEAAETSAAKIKATVVQIADFDFAGDIFAAESDGGKVRTVSLEGQSVAYCGQPVFPEVVVLFWGP